MSEQESLTDQECWALFQQLFPNGLQDPAFVDTLAPEGWAQSPLVSVHHPSQEQQQEEGRLFRERLGRLRHAKGLDVLPETDTESPAGEEDPIDPIVECADILGHCLWDIFSDNHRVTTAEGKAVSLGSFRWAGAFITAFHDSPHAELEEGVAFWRHSRFYPGSLWDRRRADLSPVYEVIFRRMRRHALGWEYVPPQLSLISFNPDPSGDVALQSSVSEANYRSLLELRRKPPPTTVLAYYAVYGQWPRGWPPCLSDVL